MLVLSSNVAHAASIAWRQDLPEAKRLAARQNKPLLVVVSAKWCGYCQQMQQQTFRDPAMTQRVAADFIPVLIDSDDQPALTQQLQVSELPTLMVISADGKVLNRATGFHTAEQLNERLAAFRPVPPKQPARQVQPTR